MTKLQDMLEGIGTGYDKGMVSRRIMVPSNEIFYNLKEKSKNDSALLFGIILLAHLYIESGYMSSLFPSNSYIFDFDVFHSLSMCNFSFFLVSIMLS